MCGTVWRIWYGTQYGNLIWDTPLMPGRFLYSFWEGCGWRVSSNRRWKVLLTLDTGIRSPARNWTCAILAEGQCAPNQWPWHPFYNQYILLTFIIFYYQQVHFKSEQILQEHQCHRLHSWCAFDKGFMIQISHNKFKVLMFQNHIVKC